MLERSHAWPEGHWDWLIHLSHKHGLRCGQMIFVGGQVDKDTQGKMLNAYDFGTQTRMVIDHIDCVLSEFGAGLEDVVKLVAFYVDDGAVDRTAFVAAVAARFDKSPGPAITLVPLPWLAYPGMMVEIEAVAMLGADGSSLARQAANPAGLAPLAAPLSQGLGVGEMIFASAQSPRDGGGKLRHPGDGGRQCDLVMDLLASVLRGLGAALDDAVKLNLYYASEGARDDWQNAIKAAARHFVAPGPVVTALPLTGLPDGETLRAELLAMRGPEGESLAREPVPPAALEGWPVPWPFSHGLRCGAMVFVGGQKALDPVGAVVDPGDMVRQTRGAMAGIERVLSGFGLVLDDVVKVNAFYRGAAGPDTIVENQRIRSACFREPGPASTGVPLPTLGVEEVTITVEAIAMTR